MIPERDMLMHVHRVLKLSSLMTCFGFRFPLTWDLMSLVCGRGLTHGRLKRSAPHDLDGDCAQVAALKRAPQRTQLVQDAAERPHVRRPAIRAALR